MSNRPGQMQYKCRRCGKIFTSGTHSPKLEYTLINLMEKGTHYEPCATVFEKTLHHCDETGVGVWHRRVYFNLVIGE